VDSNDRLRVAAVIPAFNPGARLEGVIDTLPSTMDVAIVVDDGSVAGLDIPRRVSGVDVFVVRHRRNRGVGAAILTGYAYAVDLGADIAVVMAADGQMDPADTAGLLGPITAGAADYVKGNRLSHPDCRRVMPAMRWFGNCCLTFLTRIVTGQWGLMDSQCGYTAIRTGFLKRLPLEWLYPRYGFPNDLLAAVAGAGGRIIDVKVTPVYRGEASGIRPFKAAVVYPMILVRGMVVRYVAWRRTKSMPAVHEDIECGS